VPETILHHLKVKGRNKKLTLEKVIETLEEVYPDDDDDYEYYYEDANGKTIVIPKEECPKEEKGKKGYTPQDIIKTLESYKCRGSSRLCVLHEYSPPKGILLHLVSRRSAVRHVAHNCSFVGFGKPRGLLSHSGLPRCLSTGTPAQPAEHSAISDS